MLFEITCTSYQKEIISLQHDSEDSLTTLSCTVGPRTQLWNRVPVRYLSKSRFLCINSPSYSRYGLHINQSNRRSYSCELLVYCHHDERILQIPISIHASSELWSSQSPWLMYPRTSCLALVCRCWYCPRIRKIKISSVMGFDRFHSWIYAPQKIELVISRPELASVSSPSSFLTFAMMMFAVIDQLPP